MAAFKAPAEEPATRRTGSPRSAKTAATPASLAPLAPPPEKTRAIGASGSTSDEAQPATAGAGASNAVSNARVKIQREEPPHVTGESDSGLSAALDSMAAEYISGSREVIPSPIASLRHTRSKIPVR